MTLTSFFHKLVLMKLLIVCNTNLTLILTASLANHQWHLTLMDGPVSQNKLLSPDASRTTVVILQNALFVKVVSVEKLARDYLSVM